MRKWGVVLSLFYTVIVLGLIIPATSLLVDYHSPFSPEFFDSLKDFYGLWFTWFVAVILIAGEAILLFLTVDTSQKRLKPRTHIAVSYTVTAAFFALLIFAGPPISRPCLANQVGKKDAMAQAGEVIDIGRRGIAGIDDAQPRLGLQALSQHCPSP